MKIFWRIYTIHVLCDFSLVFIYQVEISEIGRSDGSFCMRRLSTTMPRKETLKKKRPLILQKAVE